MADIDLKDLSLDELEGLQKDIDKAIKSYEARMRKEALAAAEAIAKDAGYSLTELVNGAPKSKKAARRPKYRHPEYPELTWAGRGRQPAWFKELVDAGTPEEELLI